MRVGDSGGSSNSNSNGADDRGYGDEQIGAMAAMLERGGISPDEQDSDMLAPYIAEAQARLGVAGRGASERLVYEALLYMKLKSASPSADPLQEGDRFGAGFS